jgi:hypothetical protein
VLRSRFEATDGPAFPTVRLIGCTIRASRVWEGLVLVADQDTWRSTGQPPERFDEKEGRVNK